MALSIPGSSSRIANTRLRHRWLPGRAHPGASILPKTAPTDWSAKLATIFPKRVLFKMLPGIGE